MAKRQSKVSDDSRAEQEIASDLDSIYFDTNVLYDPWPALSDIVERISVIANELKISVFIPEVVRQELDAHWPDRFDEARKTMRMLIAAGVIESDLPAQEQARTSYERSVKEVLATWNFETIPLTDVTCKELLDHAMRQDVAFEKDGRNLQDSLIVLSVLEHMVGNHRRGGIIVSNDDVFNRKRAVLEALFKLWEVQLSIAPPWQVLDWLKKRRPETTEIKQTVSDSIIITDNLSLHAGDSLQGRASTTLKLEAMSWSRNRPDPSSDRIIQYRVVGLPPNEEAWIAYFGKDEKANREKWSVLHEKGGVRGKWRGDYPNAAAAALSLQNDELTKGE